jgi:hypothetical protein
MTANDAYLRREWSRIYVEHGRLRPIPIFVVEFGEPIQLEELRNTMMQNLFEERTQQQELLDNMAAGLLQAGKREEEQKQRLATLQGKLIDLDLKTSKAAIAVAGLSHLAILAGIVPGIDPPCRCDQCRAVARDMAEAGYLFTVKDRWWEEGL